MNIASVSHHAALPLKQEMHPRAKFSGKHGPFDLCQIPREPGSYHTSNER